MEQLSSRIANELLREWGREDCIKGKKVYSFQSQ